jgi:hypothetical protein
VGFVALVATAACGGRVDGGAPTGVAGGFANEGGVALDAGSPPPASAGVLGCVLTGDAATAAAATDFVAVSVGTGLTCGLTANGAVQCWDYSQGISPVAVVSGLESGIVAVSVGGGLFNSDSRRVQSQKAARSSAGAMTPTGSSATEGLSGGATAIAVTGFDGCALTTGTGIMSRNFRDTFFRIRRPFCRRFPR